MEDRLAIHGVRMLYPLAEITCTKVETVDVGGPGLVKTGGGVIGGSFGPVGAAEGIAVAAIFNALTTRRSTKTMVRVQPATAELFFLYTRTEPGALRIELSRALGAVRDAQGAKSPANTAAQVAELSRLADLLESGLLTREEFDSLKARLLADSGS